VRFPAGFENSFRSHGTESVTLTEAVCSGRSHASSRSGHLESGRPGGALRYNSWAVAPEPRPPVVGREGTSEQRLLHWCADEDL
jgi:hypothetical protein